MPPPTVKDIFGEVAGVYPKIMKEGGASLGAWLVDTAPKGAPLAPASRTSKRGDAFATTGMRARKRAKR